jgi:branched-chain amino acid transport system permease protein
LPLIPREARASLSLLGGFALVLAVAHFFLPQGIPRGILLLGLVIGSLQGLLAMGLVLVYRTNRVINFAQGSLGAFASVLAVQLTLNEEWNFYVAAVTGIVAAAIVSGLMEFSVVRRLFKAPRLLLTVATIGLAQLLDATELLINVIWGRADFTGGLIRTPLSKPVANIFPIIFDGNAVLVLVVAPLIVLGLALFFRFSRVGVGARAAAENADRARLLGIRVKRLSTLMWILAGALSAVTAILRAPVVGFAFGALTGPAFLIQALAAAAIGRFRSLPVTFAASLLIGVAEQAIFWNYRRGSYLAPVLFVIVLVALLVQRKRLGREAQETSSWAQLQEIRPVPRELLGVPAVRALRIGIPALLVLVALFIPAVLSPSTTRALAIIALYAVVGVSLVMLTGWAGQISLGHWALFGVGAMTVGAVLAHTGFSFVPTFLIAGAVGAAVAFLIGLPALRIRGLYLAATTFAFAVAAGEFFFDLGFLQGDEFGTYIERPVIFGLFDTTSDKRWYYVAITLLVASLWFGRNLRRSRVGRALVAARDNETASMSYGVRLVRLKLGAFAVSGFMAAAGGALFTFDQHAASATSFPAARSVAIFTMVVIGGLGSLTGAILGAFYVQGITYFMPSWAQVFATGFGMLILLLVFPGGLGGIVYHWRDRFLRWIARREDIVVPSLLADVRVDVDIGAIAVSPDGDRAEKAREVEHAS